MPAKLFSTDEMLSIFQQVPLLILYSYGKSVRDRYGQLLNHNGTNIVFDLINALYDPLQDYQAQVAITYQSLLQSKKKTKKSTSAAMVCILFGQNLGEHAEQRTVSIKQLYRYYATTTVRIYYIFRKWRADLIDKTTTLTLPLAYELKTRLSKN
ncbi:hypothetical protein C2G38_2180753 [Gigaspora rosea]|uniref:Uncharacterized protein n=1 Tax=Gigaspora rosea TaxID=44941 RepID=A0A397VBM5_9GLOM|nr:hypothetical protein C2G38_2180753 [Gigaspora rosea]